MRESLNARQGNSAIGLPILGDVMLPWFHGDSFLIFYNLNSCELLCACLGESYKEENTQG